MKDEIKEINIPESVLVALADLTNGALNYYQANKAVKIMHDIILDYITNLQEKYDIAQKDIETLTNNYNDSVKMSESKITNLQEELKQIKDSNDFNDKSGNFYMKKYNDYKSRIDKAIEKIKSVRIFGLRSGKTLIATLLNEVLDILQGSDKE